MDGFPEKVLLASDGPETTALAGRAAVDLARGGGAELHVVHVWHTVPSPDYDDFVRSGLKDAGRETLDAQVRRIQEAGGTVAGAHLREGRAVEEIVGLAEEVGADLVVVGSRGMGRLGRLVMGSVSTDLAHRSSCPVLIVREGDEEWPPGRVVVGYGSFENTDRAGPLGAGIARAIGAGVDLVGVVDDGDDARLKLREMERALEGRADEIGEATGERPRVLPLVGDRRRVLLDVLAEADGPVLLSFASKVLGKAGSVMVGKVLDQVLGETGGPVLVTPEPHPSSRARSLKDAQAKDREGPAVLIATDGSEVALRAGEYAARLAGGLGAKLFVLYVVDEHQAFHAGVHYGQFVGMLSQDGREATGRVRALAEEAGIECEEFVVFGRPQQAILAAAEELEAEPIVLGAEGMSRLQHAFVGSVSEEVLRNANRTVVVVGGHPTGGPDGSPGAER